MNSNVVSAQRASLLTGRALLGLYFIVPGITKITGFANMVQYMTDHNVPLVQPLLILTIVLQIGCGASLVAGWRSQLMAFVLAGLTLVISIYMHNFWVMEEGLQRAHEMQNFVKNMAIVAGLLYVAGVTPASKD
ncbi:DoxX family protein [Congregibacter brevis]|uniref:DoxX family protein n=1 Tax=Congregibacter brevis TaxID=3081201 RepID=A0ABZ0ID54_9GAMM|nr:DoxX family protein [Congregibacter sp. IMCC45268]